MKPLRLLASGLVMAAISTMTVTTQQSPVRDSASQDVFSAAAPGGIFNIDNFLNVCPQNDFNYAAIRNTLVIRRNGVVYTGTPPCTEPYSSQPASAISQELQLLQALRTIFYMDRGRSGHLAWTPATLWGWLTTEIGGIEIDDVTEFDHCCRSYDGKKHVVLVDKVATTVDAWKSWPGMAGFIGLIAHEARHAKGPGHVTCSDGSGSCDAEYNEANIGSYGVQYFLYRAWLMGDINAGWECFATARRNQIATNFLNTANSTFRPIFNSNQPPVLNMPSQQGGTCFATNDQDSDTLSDSWELQFGLDFTSAAGVNGAAGDADGDGVTNAAEFAAGTHPRGLFRRYFAEGATSAFFDATFAVLNPGVTAAHVQFRFLKPDGTVTSQYVDLAGLTRRTIVAKHTNSLANEAFSTVVESDVLIVVDRSMTWDANGYGSHAETAVIAPATEWFLAEGAIHSNFNLFYLIQNANASAATVQVTYLRGQGGPLQKSYNVPANSRFNIWVNNEAASLPGLANQDLSARLTSNLPVIVERAMYLDAGGTPFGAGHDSAGITAAATSWFLAEGATGPYFDLFVLIANPNAGNAAIEARFLLPNGTVITRNYTVLANSRFNIFVDTEPGLANTAVSTTITSTNGVPVVVERAMWWPGPTSATWAEAHNSPGSTVTGTRWALAEGEEGSARLYETYILVANTSATAGSVRVTLLFEDGVSANKTFPIAGNSRLNVDVGAEFASSFSGSSNTAKKFGAIVESLGGTPAQIVVERAMYSNAGGVIWAAGTNALATRLQ